MSFDQLIFFWNVIILCLENYLIVGPFSDGLAVAEPGAQAKGSVMSPCIRYGVVKLRNKIKCILLVEMIKIHWCPMTP
jgi:hypothetical protein